MCLHISPPVQCVYTTVEEEEEEERDVCRHTVHHQDIKNVSHYSFFFLFFCFNSRNRPAPLFPLLSASCYRVDTCGELGNSSAAINGRNSSRRHCVSSKAPKQRASFICLYTLGGEREISSSSSSSGPSCGSRRRGRRENTINSRSSSSSSQRCSYTSRTERERERE